MYMLNVFAKIELAKVGVLVFRNSMDVGPNTSHNRHSINAGVKTTGHVKVRNKARFR
jgi:hypothetical protein